MHRIVESIARYFVVLICRIIAYTFFSEITLVGMERVPPHGPVILVGNHNNQFVDAALTNAVMPRAQRFLIANVSMTVELIGTLAKLAGAISVQRPQDMAYAGMGRIVEVIPFSQWEPSAEFYSRRRSSMTRQSQEIHPSYVTAGSDGQKSHQPTLATVGSVIRHPENFTSSSPSKVQGGIQSSGVMSSQASYQEPTVVVGDSSTRFPLDMKKHDKIVIQCSPELRETSPTAEVLEIISDHIILVKESIADHPAFQKASPETTGADAAASPSPSRSTVPDDGASGERGTGATSPEEGVVAAAADNDALEGLLESDGTMTAVDDIPTIRHASSVRGRWGFKILPKVDQGEIFESVCKSLYEGESICIFPEGGSHDRPDLLPLKPGVALMALNAVMMGVEDVLILPFGIHYYERHKFGSRAVVQIGQPIPVTQDMVELYASNQRREAVTRLMNQVKEGMKMCVIAAPDYDTIKVIDLCASLYPPDKMNVSAENSYQLRQLFGQLINRFPDHSETLELRQAVLAYSKQLEDNGIPDHEVWQLKQPAEQAILSLIQKIGLLLLFCIIAGPPMVLWGPYKLALNKMADAHRRKKQAASTVKITGIDVVASYKIIWTLISTPIILMVLSVVGWISFSKTWGGLLLSVFIAWVSLPPILYELMRLSAKILPLCRHVRCLYRVIISELDVWRDGERELIFDRIDLQLRVRNFVAQQLDEDVICRELSWKATLSMERSQARLHASQSQTSLLGTGSRAAVTGAKPLSDIQAEFEKLIPFVVVDADTRRLLRAKERYIPLVYRSALASREEIL